MARSTAAPAVSVERFFQFSLLGLVASGYLAVAGSGYLDLPTIVLTGAGLLLRALWIAGILSFEIPERTATLLAVSYIGFFGLDYLFLSRDFLSATVHLVFFLAVMKILTARTGRDYLYTAAIAFLELLAAAVLSADLNFFLCLAFFLLFAMAALTSAEICRCLRQSPATARGGWRRFQTRLALVSGFAAIGILSLTGALFFLLPRSADAALAHLMARRIHLPGFSNQVTLGEIGEIKTTSRPVMHIAIFSRDLPAGLKWRGGALAQFDGKRWSNPQPADERMRAENRQVELQPAGLRTGKGFNYHVDLNAVETTALFFAGIPETLGIRPGYDVYRNRTDSYRLGRLPPEGFGYDAYSRLEVPPELAPPDPDVILPPGQTAQYLQLPQLDPRIPQLARAMAAGADTGLERARALERRLRTDYGYTLELPDREIADPLAYFLFTRREGYCEYFASAMTVMLRTLGIPARLATGFQSGIYNPLSDLWLVRASDAHTWVEAWIPGHGWTTFDPTPPDPNPPGLALLTRLGLYLDAGETFWQDWVVSYDLNHQGILSYRMELGARRLGLRWSDSLAGFAAGWRTLSAAWFRRYLVLLLTTAVIAALLCLWGPRLIRLVLMHRRVRRVRRGQAVSGDATLLYQNLLHILHQRGYEKPPWFTPAEFAATLAPLPLRSAVAEFTATYNEWRFGGRTDVAPRLSLLLDQLERQEL